MAATRTWPSSNRARRGARDVLNGIGLILNPHAGRDVRRLVAPATSLTNHERMNVARRVLVGAHAAGVRRVWYLPERYEIAARAGAGLPGLEMVPAIPTASDEPADTLAATQAMVEAGARVLITHGGDGTNRLVATRAADVPLLPLPAGTNNVFPINVEATSAGFAAGVLARGEQPPSCVQRHKRIRVSVDGQEDFALVDAAIIRDPVVGSRAVWDPRRVVACLVTRAAPGAVGLSGLAGAVVSVRPAEPLGVFVEMGRGTPVIVLIAPGAVSRAEIRSVRTVNVGETIEIEPVRGTISLDGERHLLVHHQTVRMTLAADGPRVVNVPATLGWAQRSGFFRADAEA